MTRLLQISSAVRRGLFVEARFLHKIAQVQLCTVPPSIPVRCRIDRNAVKTEIRAFHVSSPRKAIPPGLVILLRYFLRATTMVSGKLLRKWWQRLPPEKREKVRAYVLSKRSKFAFVVTTLGGFGYLYYLVNIVEDPITKRRRFMVVNQKHLEQFSEVEHAQLLKKFKSDMLPVGHPVERRVRRVVDNLLASNSDLQQVREKRWKLTVIQRDDVVNAAVLPNGQIFVFTGILNLCTNDDQLAFILGHEMSHAILNHVAELMSSTFLVQFLLLVPLVVFWMVFPDGLAFFSGWVADNLVNVLVRLPHSRALEKEADLVGLQLAARSCYDIREAPAFWEKMNELYGGAEVEWLSTHPNHGSRELDLQELLPEALHLREKSNCPPLRGKLGIPGGPGVTARVK